MSVSQLLELRPITSKKVFFDITFWNSTSKKNIKKTPFTFVATEFQLLKSNFKLDLLQYYQAQLKSLLGWRKIKVSDWQLER